jgi:transposase
MLPKRKYDREFKVNSVKLYQNSTKGKSQIARDLGVSKSAFSRWVQEIEKQGEGKAFPGEGKIKANHEEIYKLKRELAEAIQERDILKKALAIFSQKPARKSDMG